MQALAAALVLLALAAPAVKAAERPHAEMLLDLDLLRESDPRAQRDQLVARDVRLLELLERLQAPAAARRGGDARPAPKEAC
jgi:hypothetical protein